MNYSSTNRSSRNVAGFSLVEVVIAVGVVSFAFVAILGLIPAGLTQFRQAMDVSISAQIAQRVISDAQQTDFDVLTDAANVPTGAGSANFTFIAPTVAAPATRYFDEQGNEVVSASTSPTTLSTLGVIYHVNTRVAPTTALPRTNSGGDSAMIATITVQVAFNPGNKTLPPTPVTAGATNPTGNLFTPTPGVNIITYFAQIARNK